MTATMDARSLAVAAAVLADTSRASICLALMDGRAWTAGELAAHVGIARSTATEQLNRLVGSGLLADEHQGRHRYVRLAGPGVANLIESLGAIVGVADVGHSLSTVQAANRLRAARTCYDHLAGALGVAVYEAMVSRGYLDDTDGLFLTPSGRGWIEDLTGALPRSSQRPAVRSCLDWTERRPHLGGAVAARLLGHALRNDWMTRPLVDRELRVTDHGKAELFRRLGV